MTKGIEEDVMAGHRELLRAAVGDALVDAPAQFCRLDEADGQLVEARLSGGYIPQYLIWLAERPLPALRTLVLEKTTMRDWTPMAGQVAGLNAPALSTLVLGGPAGVGARLLHLSALPTSVLAKLQHLSITARFLKPLSLLGPATQLRSLTLELEPKVDPVDLAPLAALIDGMPELDELAIFGPLDEAAAQAVFEALPPRVESVEIDALGGSRWARTTPQRAAVREGMQTAPEAIDWWTGPPPLGTRLCCWEQGEWVTYQTELPDTRVLGRCTRVGPDVREDRQLWLGREHGWQRARRGKQVTVYRVERGVPMEMEIRDLDGSLVERRVFENGQVVRTEKVNTTPAVKKRPASPYEGEFAGRSSDHIEVLATTRYDGPNDVPADVAARLIERFGPHAEEPTMAAVWALTDEGVVHHRCRLRTTEAPIEVVTVHLGDTLVGIGIQDGKVVASVDDGYMTPAR